MGRAAQISAKEGGHRRVSPALVAVLASTLVLSFAWATAHFELTCPSWVTWQERSLTCDLDGDGSTEHIKLQGRKVDVTGEDGRSIYVSDHAWRVSDVLAADVTGNGANELVMLVWRRGNYGTSRPFWDTGIDLRMTQHLYVMGLRDGTMRPVWMSHELGDGLQLAQVICPAPGQIEMVTRQGERSTWEWNYFGFWRDI